MVTITLLSRFHCAQNRSNQMKGYARIWKWVRVLEKLTSICISIYCKIKIAKIGVIRFQEIPLKIILGDNRGTKNFGQNLEGNYFICSFVYR